MKEDRVYSLKYRLKKEILTYWICMWYFAEGLNFIFTLKNWGLFWIFLPVLKYMGFGSQFLVDLTQHRDETATYIYLIRVHVGERDGGKNEMFCSVISRDSRWDIIECCRRYFKLCRENAKVINGRHCDGQGRSLPTTVLCGNPLGAKTS